MKRCILALDTGSTYTVVAASLLRRAGYRPAQDDGVAVITPSGSVRPGRVKVDRFAALGEERDDVVVLAHDFPAGMPVDGLLGLDFFRGTALTIDFANGFIELNR